MQRQTGFSAADRVVDDSGTRHANIQRRFRLTDAVKRARHERIVFDGIREADELCAGEPELIACTLGGFLDQATDTRDGIHIDSGASRGRIHRPAQPFGYRKSFRNRIQKLTFVAREALVHQR